MDELTSRPATIEDLKKVIKSLNDNKVDYLLIGGYAIQAHGYIRTTTDIDILVPADKITGEKVIQALLVLPDKCAKDIDLSWFEEDAVIRLGDEVVVDIMFNACGETYDSLKKYAETIEFDGVQIRTVNLEGLLLTKKGLRDKDIPDRIILKKALEEQRKKNIGNSGK
ncbi:MAG: nucleotidyltransferase [Elusimicrobiota bacterium]|nr:nucleotidyltransferase [Elusimicrobiota bacterium]